MTQNEIAGAVILVVITAFVSKHYVLWKLRRKINGYNRKETI